MNFIKVDGEEYNLSDQTLNKYDNHLVRSIKGQDSDSRVFNDLNKKVTYIDIDKNIFAHMVYYMRTNKLPKCDYDAYLSLKELSIKYGFLELENEINNTLNNATDGKIRQYKSIINTCSIGLGMILNKIDPNISSDVVQTSISEFINTEQGNTLLKETIQQYTNKTLPPSLKLIMSIFSTVTMKVIMDKFMSGMSGGVPNYNNNPFDGLFNKSKSDESNNEINNDFNDDLDDLLETDDTNDTEDTELNSEFNDENDDNDIVNYEENNKKNEVNENISLSFLNKQYPKNDIEITTDFVDIG